jgi:proline iminopeptidase
VIILSLFYLVCAETKSEARTRLWPEITPYKTDYLKVSGVHKIYYELCGNPKGKPVFVLHGGPGAHISPYYRRFFNPDKFLIVLHDQRGCGKSKPFAELRGNTTQELVEDIEKLRRYLELDKIILFGGSWGSTLGLAYGETYPENVNGIVLRAIFTATKKEIDHFYHGGVRQFFPEEYDRLIDSFPESERSNMPAALLKKVKSKDQDIREKYTMLWTKYEYKIGALVTPESLLRDVDKSDPKEFYSFALLENYYMANGCFFEENQLLKNLDKLHDIPLVMVNGRYDMICPPNNAYRIHQKLPKSKLIIAEGAGHWMGDLPIERALLRTMSEFE